MQIKPHITALSESTSTTLVIGVNTDTPISESLAALNAISQGFFSEQLKNTHLPQKAGEIRTFYNVPKTKNQSVTVVGIDNSQKSLISVSKALVKHLRAHRIDSADVTFLHNDFGLGVKKTARLIAQSCIDADYMFEQFKSEKQERESLTIQLIVEKAYKDAEQGITEGIAIGNGMNTLKNLGNTPGNVCTPKYLAKEATTLAKKHTDLSVEILKESKLKKLKMGALLSIAQGSHEKPRLIKISYNGSKNANKNSKKSQPIVLVGKGVTFDTGGISLKPGAGMDEMKYDMCGAGSVIGTIQAIAEMNLPIDVIGIVPAVENMPSGKAIKPGDIVTSMSGKTIEILNTDAEGRMILCDALTYAQQFDPKAIIDIATLTGAVIVGLGRKPSGLMSNNDELASLISDAGESSGDRVWRLPLWEEYLEQLQSPFADLQNIGGPEAGSITAGCFLGEFVKDSTWAHIDIAGTAWQGGKNKGATGRPVPLLVEYLMSQAHQ